MNKLKLFLVGGFLGSGKTTAIQQAAQYLHKNNKKVGVITNDQGSLLVDTEYIKGYDIPTEEVAAGCFCCHYDELEDRITALRDSERPDVIFAEPVGSCVDLAATVINPLLSLNPDQFEIVLSVFADIRLLIKFLQDGRSIFYDNVNYIYENQLEEADIIVVSKIDLLETKQLELAKQLISNEYSGKTILFQNSLSEQGIRHWLDSCNEYRDNSLRSSLDINYDIYGAGEAELAWLDEEIGILTPDGTAVKTAYAFIRRLYQTITTHDYPIGHLKFLIDDGQQRTKVSFTAMSVTGGADETDSTADRKMATDRVVIIVNARIQVEPTALREIVNRTILETETESGCRITEYNLSAFRPGYPAPTHRIAGTHPHN